MSEAFRGSKGRTAVALCCMVCATAGYTAAVRLSGACVDALLASPGAAGGGRRPAVVLAVAALACGLTGSLAWSASDLLMSRVSSQVTVRLRARMLRHTLSLPLRFFGDRSVGEVTDRISTDVDTVGNGLVNQVKPIVMGALGALAALLASATVDVRLTLLFVPAAVAVLLAGRRTAGSVAGASRTLQAEWAEAAGTAEEAFAARDDLRQTLGRGMVMRRWSQHAARLIVLSRASGRARNRLTLATIGLLRLFQLITLLAGSWLAVRGQLRSGEVWAAFGLVTLFARRIEEVLASLPRLSQFVAATQRIDELLAETPEPSTTADGGSGARVRWDRPVEVRFEQVRFRYPDGPPVLHDVSFTVRPGRCLALVGRTGSGKTTLARLVNRSVPAPAGCVFLAGVDVGAIDLAQLRRHIGVVAQRVEVLRTTLRDNVALFDPAVTDDRIDVALRLLGLGPWLAGLPDGLDTDLGEGRLMLSAGQQQLIAFARLLVRDPAVVVLDEASARLDPGTEALVRAATGRLLAGRTSIIVAHRLATLDAVDDVVVLDEGRVIECGSRVDLLADPRSHFARLVAAAAAGTGVPAGTGRVSPPPVPNPIAAPASAPPPRPVAAADGQRARVGLLPVSLRLLTRHPRLAVPGIAGYVLFLAIPALGAWAWSGLLPRLRPGGDPWPPVLLVAACSLLLIAGKLAGEYWFGLWWTSSLATVRSNLLAAQLHPHDDRAGQAAQSPGDATSRMWDTLDVVDYADHYVDLLGTVAFLTLTVLLGRTWATLPWLIAPVLLPLAVAGVLLRSMQRVAIEHARLRSQWSGHVADVCAAATTIKGYGAERDTEAFLDGWTRRRQRAALQQRRLQLIVVGSIFVTAEVGQRVVLLLAALASGGASSGGSSSAVAAAVATAEAVALMPMGGMIACLLLVDAPMVRAKLARIGRLLPSQRTFDLTRGPADLRLSPRGAPAEAVHRLPTPRVELRPLRRLEVRDLWVVHGDGTVALAGVDLSVDAGELVIVTGVVASGKSTLLRVLSGLQPASAGELRWNGVPVEDPSVLLRPPNCAYVAQAPRLVSGTIRENVALDHEADVEKALALAELQLDVARVGGVDTVVGHRGLRLSGGQTQRLATARAAAAGTELLVLDDLSSALDVLTERRLWRNVRQAGHTVVASSYKRVALELADRVVVLDDGRVAAVGSWQQLQPRFAHLAG